MRLRLRTLLIVGDSSDTGSPAADGTWLLFRQHRRVRRKITDASLQIGKHLG
jgi:hypothetical protein